LNPIHIVAILRFFPIESRAHPNRPVEIKVRDEEGQLIQADIVCKSAVGLVDATEIVEVSSLAERERLIGVAQVYCGLTGEEDQAVRDTELAGDIARVLFSCTRKGG
jgi:hypothetical protein